MEESSEFPVFAYVVLGFGFVAVLIVGLWSPDLSYDLLIELSAAAFLIIVVGWAVTHTKRKQWGAVKQQTEYLISRTVHRIRQGVAVRAFGFEPAVDPARSDEENEELVRVERRELLDGILDGAEFKIHDSLWTYESYFEERAQDVWNLINMKSGDYLAPQIVSLLQDLYVQLEDLQTHIRAYSRGSTKKQKEYYARRATTGAAFCLKEILRITRELREKGYSEPPRYA